MVWLPIRGEEQGARGAVASLPTHFSSRAPPLLYTFVQLGCLQMHFGALKMSNFSKEAAS